MILKYGLCEPRRLSYVDIQCDECGFHTMPFQHVRIHNPKPEQWPDIWQECRELLNQGILRNSGGDMQITNWHCTEEQDLCPKCAKKKEVENT